MAQGVGQATGAVARFAVPVEAHGDAGAGGTQTGGEEGKRVRTADSFGSETIPAGVSANLIAHTHFPKLAPSLFHPNPKTQTQYTKKRDHSTDLSFCSQLGCSTLCLFDLPKPRPQHRQTKPPIVHWHSRTRLPPLLLVEERLRLLLREIHCGPFHSSHPRAR